MFKHIIVGVFVLIASASVAQEGTTSPYSFYGLGTLKFTGTTENRSMGGIGIFSDSIHLNLQNPAGFAELKLINLSLGGSARVATQKTTTESQKTSTTSLDYLAIGVPMGKFGMGFGLIPYTSVGYHFLSDVPDGMSDYTGTGGVNKIFFTLAYQITPKLSFGADVNYNFGNIENTALTQKDELQYATRVFNKSDLRGFSFNLGASYKTMVTESLQLTTSLTYTPETDLEASNIRKIATVFLSPTGSQPVVDERDIIMADTKFTFPSQFTLGVGIGKPKAWAVGAEYSNQQTSDFSNRTFSIENVTYNNASKYRLGGYYIPNYNSYGNYFKRIVYRAGVRVEETGIAVAGQDINEFGISFGLGLPVGRLFSNINLGFEIGRRGTTDFGLIQENFFNTFLSFSFNDRWFEKRLYD